MFRSCALWLDEFRHYHRLPDRGVVKEKDDVISASRYAFMARRFARLPDSGRRNEELPELQAALHADLFSESR